MAARVAVLADDLIWATRLAGFVRAAGSEALPCRDLAGLARALGDAPVAIVDLTARAYEPLAAVRSAAAAGARILCVAQHDDAALRRAALDGGASRVVPYRKLAEAGEATIGEWLAEVLAPRARPEIPAARYGERLAGAARLATEAGIDAILVGVGADLRYLAGYDAMPLERLTMLVVPAGGRPTLIAPRLEAARAGGCPAASGDIVDLVTWEETEDPLRLVASLISAAVGRPAEAVALSDRLWAAFVLGIQAALPGARTTLASRVLRSLRMVKDPDEVELLRLAGAAADRVVEAIAAGPLVGRTEIDVSREVRARLVDEGHDSAEFAIVGSGPNSASPHHGASHRLIGAGEPIVLDIGGTLGGYGSDTTRTLWVTGGDPAKEPDREFLRLYEVLREAQAAASAAVHDGAPAEQIDAAAREPIAAAGFGPAFMHRTGHGIGLEEHEDPYLVAGNGEPLRAGMAFSIEPGIYLEGRYGARIEDIVVCGATGPIVLNHVRRELLVVPG